MEEDKRIKIVTNVDRPHITYEILSVLKDYDLGIKMMEVYTYVIYLRIPGIKDSLWDQLSQDIYEIHGVKSIEEIDLIAFEERNIETKRILDIIPQGVIVLDRQGIVKYSNKYLAERILKIPSDRLINKNILDFIDDSYIARLIKSQSREVVRSREVYVDKERFIADLTPIDVDGDNYLGYILSMNETSGHSFFKNDISFEDIIGNSKAMAKVIEEAKKLSKLESPIFIFGEMGTGKEIMARSIHNYSHRRYNSFISINCGDIPEKLLERELFGSGEAKIGLLELADGASIFFDNIDKMSTSIQLRLVDFLEKGHIIREFNGDFHKVDTRIISASSENIYKAVSDGRFNLDLFKILSGHELHIPALRHRKEDIPVFTQYFLDDYARRKALDRIDIDPKALDFLSSYNWPGNIRELQNVLERAAISSGGTKISKKDIHIEDKKWSKKNNMSLTDYIEDIERRVIVEELSKNPSIRATARSLKVTHTLLLNRINKYDIKDREWRSLD